MPQGTTMEAKNKAENSPLHCCYYVVLHKVGRGSKVIHSCETNKHFVAAEYLSLLPGMGHIGVRFVNIQHRGTRLDEVEMRWHPASLPLCLPPTFSSSGCLWILLVCGRKPQTQKLQLRSAWAGGSGISIISHAISPYVPYWKGLSMGRRRRPRGIGLEDTHRDVLLGLLVKDFVGHLLQFEKPKQ